MTREQTVTSEPTPLAGIVAGTRYFLQNSGGFNSARWLRVAVKANLADVDLNGGFVLQFGQGETVSAAAGETVYIWHNGGPADNFIATYDDVA